jgi:predicted DNA-binding protein
MPKEVQMSIKMEPELRARFMAVAASRDRPAAQIIRDLMRLYITDSETPNALTAETLRKSLRNEDVFLASNSDEPSKQPRKAPRSAAAIFDSLTMLPEDFMSEGRQDAPPQEREPF